MTISEIFQLMSIPLNDSSMVTYAEPQRLESINAALRTLVTARPDSNSALIDLSLVAGSLQTFPDGCEHFLDLCYRLGADGQLSYPLRLVSRKDLDNNDDQWPMKTGEVQELATDDRFPTVFWVYPVPVDDTQKIKVGVATNAPMVTAVTDEWPLKEKFIQPCIEYALYQLFSRDSTVVANAQNASMHLQAFNALIGMDAQNIVNISPVSPDYKEA